MASPSVRQHRAPTVPRQGPAHVRSRLSSGGAAYDTVAYDLVVNNADLWLSSKGLSGAITQWDAKVGTEFAFLGSDATSESSDPTFVAGTPNTLLFDGVDDKLFISDATGLDPGNLDNQGGTFTALFSGIWDDGATVNETLMMFQPSTTSYYLQMVVINSTTLAVRDRPDGGATVSLNSTATLADADVFTCALVLDGADIHIDVVLGSSSGVRTSGTRSSNPYPALDRIYLGSLVSGSRWPGSISDYQVFSTKALTLAEVESIHDLNRTAAYPA